jgi:hypothetical protein
MPRVLIADKLEAAGLDLLRQAGFDLDERTGGRRTSATILKRLQDALVTPDEPLFVRRDQGNEDTQD